MSMTKPETSQLESVSPASMDDVASVLVTDRMADALKWLRCAVVRERGEHGGAGAGGEAGPGGRLRQRLRGSPPRRD